jgi:hypothetical protein
MNDIPRRSGSGTRGNRGAPTAGAPLSAPCCTGSSLNRFRPGQIKTSRATARTRPSAASAKWRSCGSVSNSIGASRFSVIKSALMPPGSFHCCCFRSVAGVRECRARSRRAWRLLPDPQSARGSMLDSGAPRIVCAGLPDGFPFLLAQARLWCGRVTLCACLIVRPVVCVRAFTCRRARGGRDGTTGGTITHGDGSPVVCAR